MVRSSSNLMNCFKTMEKYSIKYCRIITEGTIICFAVGLDGETVDAGLHSLAVVCGAHCIFFVSLPAAAVDTYNDIIHNAYIDRHICTYIHRMHACVVCEENVTYCVVTSTYLVTLLNFAVG